MEILHKSPDRLVEEDYHSLRVEIKKLRTELDLLNYCARNFKKKAFSEPFVSVFRQAGKVRELQLEILLLKELGLYNALKNYRLSLESKLRLEKRKFFHLNGPWMREQIDHSNKTIEHYFEKADRSEVEEYLGKKRNEIRRLVLARQLVNDEIHLLRKKIKDYFYVSRIFQHGGEHYKFFDEYQELLGDWHDAVIMRQSLLNALSSGELHPAEHHRVDILVNELQEKEDKLYKKIIEGREEFIRAMRQLSSPPADPSPVPGTGPVLV